MFSFAKKAVLATALAATSLTAVSPAMAQGYPYGGYGGYGDSGYRHRDHGDSTGAAIIGGIVGIAIGALIASSGNKNNHRRYNDNAYRNGMEWRDGYYWDRDGRRYDRDGRPCEDDRNGSYSGRGQDYGNDYYGRRGYRDGDGNRGGDGYRGGYRGY